MTQNRIEFIDNLRAFSLLGVIVIHTLSFHLTNTVNAFVWNFLQFVVVAFIFCSGFVSAHYESRLVDVKTTFGWYRKRLERLYIPFLIYFIIHFSLFLIFPTVFTHFGLQKSLSFFVGSLSLFSGTNTNWLPLIFIELTALTPLLFFLYKRKQLWLYMLFAVCTTSAFTIFTFPYNFYRFVMWSPWSLILLLGLYYPRLSRRNKILTLTVSLVVYTGSFFLLTHLHKSLLFYDNKYPPTLYYLSFGIFFTLLLAAVFSSIHLPAIVQKFLQYISKNSYALFFIHYIILDFFESTILSKFFLVEMVAVCVVSLIIFVIIQSFKNIISKNIYSFSAKTTVRSE